MKVRIGYGLGTSTSTGGGERLGRLADALERHRFDSLWLSERVTGPAVDPIVGLSYVAGRTSRLKLGFSVLVLPGRNPVLLAKELASLDHLCNGRLLPAFGLGVANPAEQQAFGIAREDRAKTFNEVLPLLRRLWAEDGVTHRGTRYQYEDITVRPRPVQDPLEVWMGGAAPGELRRVGRHGDGWLPSFCTPESVQEGRRIVEEAASAAGRRIDDEHWGAFVVYSQGPLPDRLAALIAARRPGTDPNDVVPSGLPAVTRLLERYVEVGFSKFVLAPATEPADWDEEIAEVAAEVLPLQNGAPAVA